MPTGPDDPAVWAEQWETVKSSAAAAGRDPGALVGALYATVTVAENAEIGEERIMDFPRAYHGPVAEEIRRGEACCGGSVEGLSPWLQGFVDVGVRQIVPRFAGDHEAQMDAVARFRRARGW